MKKITDKEIAELKQPRTIKVKTLIIALIWVFTIFAAVIAGWNLRSYDQSRVQAEANALSSSILKSDK